MACLCLFSNLSFSSSIVPYQDLEHLTRSSGLVVVVKAKPERTNTIDGFSEYIRDFEVLDVLKGQAPAELSILSGKRTKGNMTNFIHGQFDFHAAKTYLLFLDELSDGTYHPVCLSYYVFEEVKKRGEAFFVPAYEEGSLQLLGENKEKILHVYKKESFVSEMKKFKPLTSVLDMSQMIAEDKDQHLTESLKKASPAHCSYLQSNNGLRYQVKDLDSQSLPIYYQNGTECSTANAEMQSAISHMNENYDGINLQLGGSTSGYTPNCIGGRAYNISFFDGTYDVFMEQTFGTSRAVMVQFGDPCNEIPALNNCSGTVAFGGSWAIGVHEANGESFNTAVYGYVIVNDGMGSCNCGDFSPGSPITDFSAIMAHEISHTLGLNHIASSAGQANMNPISGTQISNLDVQCMDDLYPSGSIVTPPAGTPDLAFSQCGSVSRSGNTVTVSNIQITNNGNASTGAASRLGLYLSSDTNITAADRFMTSVAIPNLSQGSSTTLSASFSLGGVPDGSYTVGMIVDDRTQITESNESNNSCFDSNPSIVIDTAPPALMDLSITSCANVSISGNIVSVNGLTVRNIGNSSTPSGAVVNYYVSIDNNITTSDILAGSSAISGLGANGSTTINYSFNSSSLNLLDGEYRVGMIVDGANIVAESNENNNSCVDNSPTIIIDTAPPPQADLSIGTCANVSVTGDNVSVNNLSVRNIGTGISGTGVKIGYYLSADNTITTADRLVANHVLPSLGVNASTSVNKSINLADLDIAPGTYTVGIILDRENILDESNENNNSCFDNSPRVTIEEEPVAQTDLVIESCGTASILNGQFRMNNIRVQNIGDLSSSAGAVVGVYVSTDQTITSTDQLATNITIPILSANSATNLNLNFAINDLNLSPGNYTVGILADINNTVVEENENNNSCAISSLGIVIEEEEAEEPEDLGQADLEITNCGTATVNANTISVRNVIVRNVGTAVTNDYSFLGYYLSEDQTITSSDIYLGYDYVSSLVANSQSSESANFSLADIEVEDGEYYVGMIADFEDRVDESNEGNNSCRINNPKVVIGAVETEPTAAVDLQVSCGTVTQTSNSLTVRNVSLRNTGNANTEAGVFIGYYLSEDEEITTDDYLIELGQDYVAEIRAGQTVLENGHFSLNTIPKGEYFFGIIIDHQSDIEESNESNNTCHIATTKISVGLDEENQADLSIDCRRTTITDNELNISSVSVGNNGTIGTGGYSFIGYYVSEDKEISRSDHYLGYDYVGILNVGQHSNQNERFLLSQLDLPDGEYYIGAIADFTQRINESTRTNNTCVFDEPKLIIGGEETVEEGECNLFSQNNFDDGTLGIWTDGGAHAFINAGTSFSTSGLRSLALRGNEGIQSSLYTNDWIYSESYSELKVSFNYYAFLMESGDSFVLEADQGNGYSVIKTWRADTDFVAAETSSDVLIIPFNNKIKLRFRTMSSHTYEYVFLDDILVERCAGSNIVVPTQASAESKVHVKADVLAVSVFPNPISQGQEVNVDLTSVDSSASISYVIVDAVGRQVQAGQMNHGQSLIQTADLPKGTYSIIVSTGENRVVKQLIII